MSDSDSANLWRYNKLTGAVNKYRNIIQLCHEGLERPDSFLNNHDKLWSKIEKYRTKLNQAEAELAKFMGGG